MVIGVGTDIIEIARVGQSIDRFGARFLQRVFTPREIAYCQSKRNAASGRPTLVLTGRAAQHAHRLGIARASLSLTHSRDIALAVVVMED